jgi:PAS domain S-box-containing protein
MPISVFNFSFEQWPLVILGLIPALFNFLIFIYVLFFVRKSALSTSFLVFLVSLIMWRVQEVVLQICIARRDAEMWYHMFSIASNFIGVTGLHFTLELINSGKWRRKNIHLVALYMPTFLLSMFFASGVPCMRFDYTITWGWVFVPIHPISIAAFILIGLHAFVMLWLLSIHTWQLRKTNNIQYKRIRIILVGSAAPILVGCMYQILLPVFFYYSPVPVASSLSIFFSFAILIAITRYNFLEFSPVHQWDKIVENMNEGIVIVDNNDYIQYVNNKFCDMLGYPDSELLNTQSQNMVVLPEGKTGSGRMADRSKKLFRDKCELILKRKDGHRIICEINSQPYLDQTKKIIGTVSIYTDVTDQRKVIKSLKESESRYRSFIEQATDGIFITDVQGNFKEVNAKVCQMLGYAREEMAGLAINNVLFVEDIHSRSLRMDLLAQNKSILYTQPLRRKDGSAIPAEINERMMPDGKILSIARDVTERKKTEEELLEKISEMDAFIYRASHDLRGPLASIAGLANLGREEVKNTHADIYFNKISSSVTRLDNILREMNKIAHVTQAKIEPAEIFLEKEIDDILDSLKQLPNYGQIAFSKEINTPVIYCDKILLIIILQNLIINSIYYYDPKKQKSLVFIKTSENEGATEITVSDNGSGIPEAIQDKVFDMFYRGTDNSSGSGLGLYIVKNAVKKLKGTIRLVSKEREGTCLTITLPKHDQRQRSL